MFSQQTLLVATENRFTLFGNHASSGMISSENRFTLFGNHASSGMISSENRFTLFGIMRLQA
jgi:hypothetical protein